MRYDLRCQSSIQVALETSPPTSRQPTTLIKASANLALDTLKSPALRHVPLTPGPTALSNKSHESRQTHALRVERSRRTR